MRILAEGSKIKFEKLSHFLSFNKFSTRLVFEILVHSQLNYLELFFDHVVRLRFQFNLNFISQLLTNHFFELFSGLNLIGSDNQLNCTFLILLKIHLISVVFFFCFINIKAFNHLFENVGFVSLFVLVNKVLFEKMLAWRHWPGVKLALLIHSSKKSVFLTPNKVLWFRLHAQEVHSISVW